MAEQIAAAYAREDQVICGNLSEEEVNALSEALEAMLGRLREAAEFPGAQAADK